MIVKVILNYTIRNKGKIYLELNQQLLINVRGKDGIGKSEVVKTIKMGFILLSRKNELVISAPIDSVANGIGGYIVHIAIEVNIWIEKNYKVKVNT